MLASVILSVASALSPQTQPTSQPVSGPDGGSLLQTMALLAAMAILPFLLTMVTSFGKMIVVSAILRQGIGVQQAPPNSVLTGICLILTVHIMWPVGVSVCQAYDKAGGKPTAAALQAASLPLQTFLQRHANETNIRLFASLQERHQPPTAPGEKPSMEAHWSRLVTVDVPAFALSELTRAFQIGFLLLIPFMVIDLVVGNVLTAMGMQMLNPLSVSLPIKLLLFVLVDGWRLVFQGLIGGYVVT